MRGSRHVSAHRHLVDVPLPITCRELSHLPKNKNAIEELIVKGIAPNSRTPVRGTLLLERGNGSVRARLGIRRIHEKLGTPSARVRARESPV